MNKQKGHEGDVERLIEEHQPQLKAFIHRRVSSKEDAEYMRSLVWQELEAALSELPAEQRTAFELMELEGLSVKEVAEATGASANTVLSRKHYAVKHLRKRLEGLYNDILTY